MSLVKMMDAFIAALMKKDSKRTEVDRFDIAQFLRCAGLYHSKILQSVLSFATVENCKTDYVIYAQHDMVGLQYWYLLKGQVRLYSSKKGRFQFVKPGSTMQATRESLAELGKYEYIVQQGDFFGVESFVESDPHAERKHSALATADGTIILPIQGATPLRHAIDYIRLPHQYQVHTLSKWCNISPELRSDHEVSLILNHLKGFKFFSRLPDHLGLSWAKMCMVVNVKAQTLLFQQNDPSDSIYFIIDGSCQVRIKKLNEPVKVPTGDGNLNWLTMDADFGDCVHTFESGDSFGELSLDHAKANQTPRRTASIICTQECVLLRVDAEAYYTLQKMGQNSRIILSQWTKPLQSAPGSRSSETIDTISFIMLDFKYFSFMNEYTRRILAQNLFLIDTEPGDIIFVEGETVFVQSMNASIDESILQPKSPNAVRKWTTDSVCAVVCGSVGAFKKKKTNESGTHDVASYLHLNTAQKINAISDVFGILQSTIVAGEGFGEDLLHRKSLDVKRNLSYVCLEPCKLVFYGQKSFASTLSPTYDLGSGKSKMIMRKPSEQRTHRDLCIIFREVASLPFIQNFVEHDFHDFFSKARFGNCPAFSVINKSFPKYCFGIVLSGAMSVHQSEEQELHKNDVATVKDAQCHAIRLMFGACKHIVKEGDIFGEYNLKSVSEKTKSSLDIIPSRCTYISRVPTEMIYWDVYDLSPKLLEESQKGIASTGRVIQIMAKSFNQKTDDDVAVLDEFLRSFKHLSQYPDLSRILSSSAFSMQELDDSDVIFREGDSVTHLYILLQGSIQTHSKLKPDPELYTGRTIFGEMSVDEFYSIGSRFSTCTVAENSTFVLQIPFEAFLQLEKQKMAAIYRSAKSYLVQHHCFKKLCSKNLSLVDDLVSDCRILFKSKNDPLYVEGHVYDRSIWAVLKGSVELILYANPGVQNSDDLVLDIKMNDFGQSTNSSAKAAFSKQSTFRHSLGVLRTGAAIAPFAVSDVQQQFYRAAADHDAAAAENDTIVAVFFMRNSKDESKAAMCMMEQEIAFLSQWRQLRKKAGDHAIVHQRSLITSPKKIALGFSASISSHQYHTVRPKTGLEGKVDSNLFLPKLAGSRRVDIIHNDDILDVNGDRFAVLSESSLQDIYVKCTRQSEEVCMDQESSKPCPSPREINNMERYEDMGNHRELIPAENTPDVGKKILDIFAADKFKRKAFMTLEIDHRHVPGVHAVSEANKVMNNSIAGSSESKSGHSSSPESQAIESKAAQMRSTTGDVFAENKNVASLIAVIMSGNKYKHNASQQQMESSISETLEAARQKDTASVEPAWKEKVVEILKKDLFQRTKEDPDDVLQHALSVAAELAQKERDSRIPKEKILIDTFCKRVREKLLLGEAVESLAFNQLDIYVPDKPVRSFGRNRISDTARKIFSQDAKTAFGADEKKPGAVQILRPRGAENTLLNLKIKHKSERTSTSKRSSLPNFRPNGQDHNHDLHNRSLNVTKILPPDDFKPADLRYFPSARVSTPVVREQILIREEIGSHQSSGTPFMTLQHDDLTAPAVLLVQNSEFDLENQKSNWSLCSHNQDQSHPEISRRLKIDIEKHAQVDAGLITHEKSELFDYLCEVAQNPTKESHHNKTAQACFSNFEASTQQTMTKSAFRKIPKTTKTELHLTGQAKMTHSVTELGSFYQWQMLQATDSIRNSQYRPIPVNSKSPLQSADSYRKYNRQMIATTPGQQLPELPSTKLKQSQSIEFLSHTLTSHLPRTPSAAGRGSTSIPKSRGYSSHGTMEFVFGIASCPVLNEVLTQNSPSSSKPQTPQKILRSPNDSRPPSRNAPAMRGIGKQPHITGIAFDDESQASQM